MRILFLKDDPYLPDLYAGVEVNTHWLALHLKSLGYDVAVAARRDNSTQFTEENDAGYPIYRDPRAPQAALMAYQRFQPDVMVNQNRVLWPLLMPRVEGAGPPIVFYEHSVLPKAALPSIRMRSRALLAANSPMLAQYFRRTLGIGGVVVPPIYGVDRFGALVRTPRHVTMVSIQRRKGADLALRLAARRPDVPFVFVGSWSERPDETQELEQELNRLGNVRVLPNRPDMSEVWAGTRLLLMPSRSREAWGRVATECQLLGIPVLGSSRGSLPLTIGPGGKTLDPEADFELWAAAFDGLWDNAGQYERCSRAARENAQGHLATLDAATERFAFLLHAASPARWPRQARVVTLPRAIGTAAAFDDGDVAWMRKLQAQVEAVQGADVTDLPEIARKFAAPPSRATAERIVQATGLPLESQAMQIAAEAACNREEVVLQCLKGLSTEGWYPTITIVGRNRLDEALAAGRGAVLWVVHTVFATNVVKMALHADGFQLSQLSRPQHGLSKTDFGMRHLNRVRTDFEDRFLVRRIRFDRARPAAAMLEARAVLQRNELLALTAGAWEGARAVEQPFLGGTLRLATGPLRLAELMNAPLLPVVGVRLAGSTSFEVRIEAPIQIRGGTETERLQDGFAQFAARVGETAMRHPAQWRGWSSLGA